MEDFGVAVELLDRLLARVAVAAIDLDGVGGDLGGHVCCERLGERGLLGVANLLVMEVSGLPDEQARGLDVHGHLCDHEADGLVLGDRATEGLALGGVLARVLVGSAREADSRRGDHGARLVERAHCLEPARAFGAAEDVVLVDAHILEGDAARITGALAHVVFLAADHDAGRVRRDDKASHPLVASVRVGVGEHEVPGCLGPVGDPHLLAVDDVVVAILDGAGLDALNVRASAWLGHGVGGHVRVAVAVDWASEQAEVFMLLLLGAVHDHGRDGQLVGLHRRADARASPGHLFCEEGRLEAAEPDAAIISRDHRVHQPEFVRLPQHRPWKLAGVVVVLGHRAHDITREIARGLLVHLLIFAQLETDHGRHSWLVKVGACGICGRAFEVSAYLYIADNRCVTCFCHSCLARLAAERTEGAATFATVG